MGFLQPRQRDTRFCGMRSQLGVMSCRPPHSTNSVSDTGHPLTSTHRHVPVTVGYTPCVHTTVSSRVKSQEHS